MKQHPPLILASGSPRRQQLLQDMGFDFSVVVREVDESFPAGLTPEETVLHIVRKKAAAYADLARELSVHFIPILHLPITVSKGVENAHGLPCDLCHKTPSP